MVAGILFVVAVLAVTSGIYLSVFKVLESGIRARVTNDARDDRIMKASLCTGIMLLVSGITLFYIVARYSVYNVLDTLQKIKKSLIQY